MTLASALEFIADRSVAIGAERIRELESQLDAANAQIALLRRSHSERTVGMPALVQAVEDCSAHFAQVIDAAKDEIPPRAKAQIADAEKRLTAAQSDAAAARLERDDAVRTSESLAVLRDAALRWDTDHYSPRLKNVISVFRRQEVAKR